MESHGFSWSRNGVANAYNCMDSKMHGVAKKYVESQNFSMESGSEKPLGSGDDGCVRLWKDNYMNNWKCVSRYNFENICILYS